MRWRSGDVGCDLFGDDVVLRNHMQVRGKVIASCFTSLAPVTLENVIDWALKHSDGVMQRKGSSKRFRDLLHRFFVGAFDTDDKTSDAERGRRRAR